MTATFAAAVGSGGAALAQYDARGDAARLGSGTCAPQPGLLGVSRVVEIDTAGGPRFGPLQYPLDFLREGEVVLTFDDGPKRGPTRVVLEALAAHCTHATFFMLGQTALSDPDVVREVAQAGHTIASHTWSHRNLRAASSEAARQEIELGVSAVQRALGSPPAPFFRYPYLADSPAVNAYLAERNIAVFSVDADSKDFKTRDPKQMVRTLMSHLEGKHKGFVLFHDIQISTAGGILGALDALAAKGYRVVHMVAKVPVQSAGEFDLLVEGEHARKGKQAARSPLAARSLVAPLAAPARESAHGKQGGDGDGPAGREGYSSRPRSAAGGAAPGPGQSGAGSAGAGAAGTAAGVPRTVTGTEAETGAGAGAGASDVVVFRGPVRVPARPAAAAGPDPAASPAAETSQPAAARAGNGPPDDRAPLRGSEPGEEDWRRRVFQH